MQRAKSKTRKEVVSLAFMCTRSLNLNKVRAMTYMPKKAKRDSRHNCEPNEPAKIYELFVFESKSFVHNFSPIVQKQVGALL